jgi:hypothetical protein
MLRRSLDRIGIDLPPGRLAPNQKNISRRYLGIILRFDYYGHKNSRQFGLI